MSDTPKIWPPPPQTPPAPRQPRHGIRGRWDALSGPGRLAVVGMVVLLVIVVATRRSNDENGATGASQTVTPGSVTTTAVPREGRDTPSLAGPTTTPVDPGRTATTVAATEEERQNSRLACERFRAVAAALPKGDALRDRLREVNDAATTATPAVQDAARAMLDAATQDNAGRILRAGGELDAACRAAGH